MGIEKRVWEWRGETDPFSIFCGLVSSVASSIYQEVALGWTCLRVYKIILHRTKLVTFLRGIVLDLNLVLRPPEVLANELFGKGSTVAIRADIISLLTFIYE